MDKTENLTKLSAQGVRDYPIPKSNYQNEDIGDVYDHVPTKQTTDLAGSKGVDKNNTMLNKKRRNGNKRHSVDSPTDVKSLLKHNEIKQTDDERYFSQNYNVDIDKMDDEDKVKFIEDENEKLLSKVLDLSFSLKAVLAKVKEKTISKPPQTFMHLNDEYKEMDNNVKTSLSKMKKMQHEINLNRRLLSNSYNIEEIENIEAQIRKKQSICDKYKSNNRNIKKWMNKNEKDKDQINEHGFYDEEVYKLKNTHREDKTRIRELYYDTLRKRKALVEKHDTVVKLESTCRKMKELIESSKKDREKTKNALEGARPASIVEGKKWDVDEMKKKVDTAKFKLKKQRNDIESEVKKQEEDIGDMEHQVKILDLKVKEKTKELNLADLKIKEIKRNLRYQTLKPLPNQPQHSARRRGGPKKKSINGNLVRKRDNDDLFQNQSSNNLNGDKNISNSEIRLDRSESSIISNQKQDQIKSNVVAAKPKKR